MSKLIFHYEFDPNDKETNTDLLSRHEDARIEATSDNENGIWLSANQSGWEYIAKIASQIALRGDLDRGMWHQSLNSGVRVLGVENNELTFGLETWLRVDGAKDT